MAATNNKGMKLIQYMLILVIILLLVVVVAINPVGAVRLNVQGVGGAGGGSGITYQGVLNMLNKCEIPYFDNSTIYKSCNEICQARGQTCIAGLYDEHFLTGKDKSSLIMCIAQFSYIPEFVDGNCICCNP